MILDVKFDTGNEFEKDLKLDTIYQQLQVATPAQIKTWMEKRVTNLTEARNVLTVLTLYIRSLDRKIP
jgi:hypothetical protein